MPLLWRIMALMALAVIGGGVLATVTQSLYVDRLYAGLAQARFSFVLQGLKSAVELNVGLGFPLAELRLAQDLIEREKAEDEQILAIEVIDDAGRTLFSTDRGTVGEEPPPAWLEAMQEARGHGWRAPERDLVAEATPLVNDFEKTIGYVVLSYAPAYYNHRAGAVAQSLGLAAAAAAGLVALLVALVGYAAGRRLIATHEAAALLTAPSAAAPETAPLAVAAPLVTAAVAARRALLAAEADVDAAMTTLRQLDDAP